MARLDAMEQRLAAMQQAVAVMRGPFERLYDLLSDEQIQRLENTAAMPEGKDMPSMDVVQLCSGESDLTTVPQDKIAQALRLTNEQRLHLKALEEASRRAGENLRTACPTDTPKSVAARLEVAHKRIAALVQAIETIRPAMAAFYGSWDQQKAALNALGPDVRSARR